MAFAPASLNRIASSSQWAPVNLTNALPSGLKALQTYGQDFNFPGFFNKVLGVFTGLAGVSLNNAPVLNENGLNNTSISLNGAYTDPISLNGAYTDPISLNGAYTDPISLNGAYTDAISLNGAYTDPISLNGAYTDPTITVYSPTNLYNLVHGGNIQATTNQTDSISNSSYGLYNLQNELEVHPLHNAVLDETTPTQDLINESANLDTRSMIPVLQEPGGFMERVLPPLGGNLSTAGSNYQDRLNSRIAEMKLQSLAEAAEKLPFATTTNSIFNAADNVINNAAGNVENMVSYSLTTMKNNINNAADNMENVAREGRNFIQHQSEDLVNRSSQLFIN